MNTSKMNTDQLFKALPKMVNVDGILYNFYLRKGSKRINVGYRTDLDEYGYYNYLNDTDRSGKTLELSLRSMLEWLIKFDYYDAYLIEQRNVSIDSIFCDEKVIELSYEELIADIRNKLNPISLLINLVEDSMDDSKTIEEKEYINRMIKDQISLMKDSIEYIKKI